MNLSDLDIKDSYKSYGTDHISRDLISPALALSKTYKRCVGFFSSSVLKLILSGISGLVKNKGTIQLIASPKLSREDIEAIKVGYEHKEDIIHGCFSRDFSEILEEFDSEELEYLVKLIARGYLDIRLAVPKGIGMYHDKFGIFQDKDENIVVFVGSANSSDSAYNEKNYEKVRVFKSWEFGDDKRISEEIEEFEALWNNTNEDVKVYEYNDCVSKNLLNVIERKKAKAVKHGVQLRDYQESAIANWINNNYNGFFVMATGTGKTWTAIYAAKELVEKYPSLIVICAPYKHLVKQWQEDVVKAFPDAKIILVSSENPSWEREIRDSIIARKHGIKKQLIIISTISSFYMDRFKDSINTSDEEKLLIVDEAHRFTKLEPEFLEIYKYKLGLSATPFSGKSAQKGHMLMNFFGGNVYNLPIEEALKKNCLVQYYYHPIFVDSTEEEERKFAYQSKLISSCFKNNVCIDSDGLVLALRARLRIIAMAQNKLNNLGYIIDKINAKDHFIVYCGDGKLFNDDGSELRHIEFVKNTLDRKGYRVSQFTAQENMKTRMDLVDSFNKGIISSLAAIRCLDEGINIPSIKSALILASNDDFREFVQRRGRILRKDGDKKEAHIFDVVVLPSSDMLTWAQIELRRYKEYAKLAVNCNELLLKLGDLMDIYGITDEQLDVFEYDEMEVDDDE